MIRTARAGIAAVAAILVLGTCSRDAVDPSRTFRTPLADVSSHAVITATLLTVGTNTVNQRVYTTAAVAPAANTLITVAVLGQSDLGTPPIPTLSGGGMAAWDVVATITFDGTTPLRRLTVFRAMSAAPGSGQLTITSSLTLSHTQWIVSQWDGAETSGVNGSGAIVQTGSIRGDAVTGLTVPLTAFGNANNVAYGAFAVNRNVAVITPGAGFTEIAEQPSGEGTPGDLQAEWHIDDNTIDATWPTSLNGGALGIEIKAAASGVDALQSTLEASPTSIAAGGGTATITVTVRDANGNPISGAMVELSATGIGNTLSAPGETDASGVYTGTLSSTVAEDKVVTATATVAGITTALNQTATVTVTPQARAITATLLTVGTDVVNKGIYTTAPISPASNTLITVAVLGHSSLGTPPIPTLSGGGMAAWDVVATITFDGTTPLRRLTVFRAMSAAPGSGQLTITSSLTLSHTQWIVSQWDGAETSGVNGSGAIVQTGSIRGDAVTGLTVPLAEFGNANNVAYGAFGVNRNVAVITPGAGFTEIAEQPSGESSPGDLQVEGHIDDNTIDATWPTPLNGGALGIEIKAAASGSGSSVDPSQSTLDASPPSIAAGGTGSTIEVTVRDAGGAPLSGVVVQLAATGTGNTLSPPGPTDLTGVYHGTLSSTKAEAKLITATARLGTVTTALNASAVVTVEPGPVSATQSSVGAEPASIQAGGQTATVTVMVKDAHDNPISGAAVQLSATGIGNTLSAPGPTDASGVYTGTLSSTVAEAKVVSATATIAGIPTALNQSATVTVTPQGATVITTTLLTVGTNTVNQRVYPTAAFAPAANTLITVAVLGHSYLGTPPIPTLSGGGMPAWDVVATVTFDGTTPLRRLTIFRAMSAAPGSGALTITSSLTLSNAQWIVSQWEGAETSGVNGSGAIVQTGSTRGDAVTSLNVLLSSFGHANNVAYGAFGVNRNVAVVTGAGFTEIAEQPSGEEGTPGDLQVEWRTNDNTIDATWPLLLNGGALGVEIKALGSGSAVDALQSTVNAAPTSITAGSGTSTITVTARSADGMPISGAIVQLAATGSGNTLTQPGPTDATGVATGTLSSTVAGAKTVSAIANGTAISQQAAVSVTAGPASASRSTVTAAPSSIQAGGQTATMTVIVKDAHDNPISGAAVQLSATGIGNTLSAPGPTDANGVYTGTLSSTVAETKVVSATATVAGVVTALNQSATVPVTPQGATAITATLLTVGTDVVNQRIYTTAPFAPAANTLVTVAVLGHSALGTPPIPTLSGGGMAAWDVVATVPFDGASSLRRLTVFRAMSATPGSGPLTITSSLTLAHSQWIVSQWGGVETSGVNGSGAVVQTGSTRGDAVTSLNVLLSSFGHANNVAYGAFGVNRNVAVVTGAGFTEIAEQPSGEYPPGDLQAEWRTNDNTIDATWPLTLNGGALGVEIKAAAPSVDALRSTLEASPTSIAAGGGTATITVTVRDANGDPISGAAVELAATGAGNTLSAPGLTDASGVYTGTLSSTVAGEKVVSATAEGASLAQTALVTVTAGAVDAGQSTVVAAPSSIPVGSGVATITVTAQDANGNPIQGATVALAAIGSAMLLTQPAGQTGADGTATGTLSATLSGTKVVSAVINGTPIVQTASVTVQPPPGSVVFVGAGDIGDCETTTDEATATLLDVIPGTVFTAGDNAYRSGTAAEFTNCYEPTWGRHKARTRPSPGNHDYRTSGASAYYAYFGASAGPAGLGYYSYDLGDWHIISMNTEVNTNPGSTQEQWLRADLAANTKQCTLAYWHNPLFSSGEHGSLPESQPLWEALYQYNAEVVVVGHDHNYERFAPQTATGVADPARGLRQFVVGTGGTDLRSMNPLIANSEVANSTTHGVLKLTLHSTGYEWEFMPVAGKTFTDSGSGSCH